MITKMERHSHKARGLWLFLLLVAVAGTAGYFYLHPESLPKWVAETAVGRELQTTTVYKWPDSSGAWHVSDQPPPAGVEYKTDEYSRDTNVLPLPPALQ